MKPSDWILIGTALFLGATALFVPWLAEVVKRKSFAPRLQVSFELKPPFCHKTHWDPGNHDVFFFRMLVENIGQSQARFCEVVFEEFWIYDASGNPIKFDNFSPVNLKWVAGNSPQFIDIHPRRKIFCSLGHLSSAAYQQTERQWMVDIPGNDTSDALRFLFDQRESFFAQPNCLVPGRYGLRLSVYSENAEQVTLYYEISWSGNWKNMELELFRELVIKSTKRFGA